MIIYNHLKINNVYETEITKIEKILNTAPEKKKKIIKKYKKMKKFNNKETFIINKSKLFKI